MMRGGENKKREKVSKVSEINWYSSLQHQTVSGTGGLCTMADDYDLYLMKLSDRNR